ncbi:MAG: DUF4198 domain-containing protein [Nitrospirae bacterium]|nr:MAG: DUF4198 domain-containing protein [Nitrospirota bacterium]
MKKFFVMALVLLLPATALAHFGMVLPSDDVVGKRDRKVLELRVQFLHPFEYQFLEMQRPEAFGVLVGGERVDLTGKLQRRVVQGKSIWTLKYRIRRPGDYIFYVKPRPYWEPAEETFIVHYTKVVVNALGLEEGWDQKVGLPVEIVPLTRPYGLWEGNVFVGRVLYKGKPLPNATVEVEYYNPDGRTKAPTEAHITQVIKTDERGIFVYGIPKEGWWGFAALTEADYKLEKDGKKYPVELGGVLWLRVWRMH